MVDSNYKTGWLLASWSVFMVMILCFASIFALVVGILMTLAYGGVAAGMWVMAMSLQKTKSDAAGKMQIASFIMMGVAVITLVGSILTPAFEDMTPDSILLIGLMQLLAGGAMIAADIFFRKAKMILGFKKSFLLDLGFMIYAISTAFLGLMILITSNLGYVSEGGLIVLGVIMAIGMKAMIICSGIWAVDMFRKGRALK